MAEILAVYGNFGMIDWSYSEISPLRHGVLLHVSYALMQGVVLIRLAVQWVSGHVLDTSSS